jgi:hypothetical protein
VKRHPSLRREDEGFLTQEEFGRPEREVSGKNLNKKKVCNCMLTENKFKNLTIFKHFEFLNEFYFSFKCRNVSGTFNKA